MRLFRGRFSSPGFRLTALASALLVALSFVSNPWTQLVRIGQGPSRGAAVLGTVVMAAALLDRWRPMRLFVRYSCWAMALAFVAAAAFGARPAGGFVLVAAGCLMVSAILASKPVRRWFAEPRDDWGGAEEEGALAPAAPPMLPLEKVEPGIPGVQRDVADPGSGVREARSKRSPEERK